MRICDDKRKLVSRKKLKHVCQKTKDFKQKYRLLSAFTIVELLIIIVVSILSMLGASTYSGIVAKANETSINSDVELAKHDLAKFHESNGVYPTTIDCDISDSSTNKCIRPSTGNSFTYSTADDAYTLDVTRNGVTYTTNNNSGVAR